MAVSDAGGEEVRERNAGINPFWKFFKHQPISNMKQLGGEGEEGGTLKGACQEAKKKKKWEREREIGFPACRESVFMTDQSIFSKTNTLKWSRKV